MSYLFELEDANETVTITANYRREADILESIHKDIVRYISDEIPRPEMRKTFETYLREYRLLAEIAFEHHLKNSERVFFKDRM